MKNAKTVYIALALVALPALGIAYYAYFQIATHLVDRVIASKPDETKQQQVPATLPPAPIVQPIPPEQITPESARTVSRSTSTRFDDTSVEEIEIPRAKKDEETAVELEIPETPERPPKFELLMNLVGKERHIPPDLIEAVLDKPDLEEYLDLWTRATTTFEKRNTPNDIAAGIERVYQAKAYYTELTVKQSLKYLLDKVPNVNVTHAEYERGTGIAIVDGESGSGLVAAEGERIGVTNVEIPDPNVRTIAEETYLWLEDEFYRPYREAEEQRIAIEQANAEALESNRQAAQNRGRANNSTRVQRGQQRTLDVENRLAPQVQRDEAARLESQRRLLGN